MAKKESPGGLHGFQLIATALIIAMANFIVILDMTIANVLVPHISGGLGASPSEGVYVITSYAIAEAITVPLTGWLALRYGTVRTFTTAMLLFGLFSALCGISTHLEVLVSSRILQGLSGGPLMPLSQTLLILIFPPEKRMIGMAIWSVTTLVSPILGPIAGGYIADNWSWRLAFIINIPLAIMCSVVASSFLKKFETIKERQKIDVIGLVLLLIFVSALQLMLDEGEKLCWFDSSLITTLCAVSITSFIGFVMWELKVEKPIVNLSVFRHRGFIASIVCMSLTFGGYFAATVLTPLWLQINMDYTATQAGLVMATNGFFAICMAPIAAKYANLLDTRKLVSLSIVWIGIVNTMRAFGTTDMTYWDVALPILFQGAAMPFFFIPVNTLALSSVNQDEVATAAGLLNFVRTISGSFATSIVITFWDNLTKTNRHELVSIIPTVSETPIPQLEQLVNNQSVMLATNQVFIHIFILFFLAAAVIWFAPKPTNMVSKDVGGGH